MIGFMENLYLIKKCYNHWNTELLIDTYRLQCFDAIFNEILLMFLIIYRLNSMIPKNKLKNSKLLIYYVNELNKLL